MKKASFILFILIIVYSCTGRNSSEQPGIPDQEPKPYTVTYSPADGSESPIDPPAFVWLPYKEATEYTLQYSRKQDFKPEFTTSVSCVRNIHIPRQTLGPGKWYWRFGTTDSTGKPVFSRLRSFTIAEDASAVPFPDIKKVIADLNGVRPRDLVHKDDVVRFRELGKGPLKEYVTEFTSEADGYINEQMHPEPPFLSEDPEQKKVDFVKIMRSTRAFNKGMVVCATAYLLTGEEKYGQEARRRMLHLAAWDPNGSTNLFHNDEPGHEIVRTMVNTYDWIYPLLSEEDKIAVRACLSERIDQLYQILLKRPFEVNPYESHAMSYFVGDLLRACIDMADEMPLEKEFEYVLQQLWSPFFPPYGGDDGGWCEGPTYWQSSTGTFLRNFSLVNENCGVDLTRKPWIQNTAYYKLYANPPYSKMSPFGDSQSGKAVTNGIMYKFGVAFNNPYALWYDHQLGQKPQGIERFIYYMEGNDEGKPPVDIPQARCFSSIGLACMHSALADGEKNVMFLMRSSPFGSISHSYADQNSFVLFAYGEPLAIASGYYPYYNSPHHSKWSWESKASNTILVDGKGQDIRNWNAKGKIEDFVTTEYVHYAVGDATKAYGGRLNKFKRQALYLRPVAEGEEPLVVLYDDIESPGSSTYDWLLHSLEKMEIDENSQTIGIKRGNARLKVQFLSPGGLKFSQTDTFTVAPEGENMPNQWHLTARTNSPAASSKFITVLTPYREGQEAALPQVRLEEHEGWLVVELKGSVTSQLVAFRTDNSAAKLKTGKFTTKAGVAAIAYDNGGKKIAIFER